MKTFPTEFEIFEDTVLMAKIVTNDEVTVSINLPSVYSLEDWKILSVEITKCLKAMLSE